MAKSIVDTFEIINIQQDQSMPLSCISGQFFLNQVRRRAFVVKAGKVIQLRCIFQAIGFGFYVGNVGDHSDHFNGDVVFDNGGNVKLAPYKLGAAGSHSRLIGRRFSI